MKEKRIRSAYFLDIVFFFLFPWIWQDIWFIAQISVGQKLKKEESNIEYEVDFILKDIQ